MVLSLVLDFEYLFDSMNILKHMAGVVKWLRPRIVVPIFVGSTPTTRPFLNSASSEAFLLGIMRVSRVRTFFFKAFVMPSVKMSAIALLSMFLRVRT